MSPTLHALLDHELQRGNAARAGELLLSARGAIAVHYRALLQRGDWTLPLSAHPKHRALADALGMEPPSFMPDRGLFVLAFHDQGAQPEGSVRRLRYVLGQDNGVAEGLSARCRLGAEAAMTWLVARIGAADLAHRGCYDLSLLQGQCVDPARETQRGESTALGASLAFVLAQPPLARRYTRRVAATGRVDSYGGVHEVAGLEPKLMTACREAPWLDGIYVPAAGCEAISSQVRRALDNTEIALVPVSTVAELLEAEAPFDRGDHQEIFACLSPLDAAERAWDHETQKEHRAAFSYASAVMDSQADWELHEVDAQMAEIKARAIVAINLCHFGQAPKASAELEHVRGLVAQTAPGLIDANGRLRLAAYGASIAIDRLDAEGAMEACDEAEPYAMAASTTALLELLGSRARALAFAGRLDEALACSDGQLALPLGQRERHQQPQMLCNRADILCRRAATVEDPAPVLGELEKILRRARDTNASLPLQSHRESNGAFLDLWTIRLCALRAEPDPALDLAGEITPDGRFPRAYLHRFAGEALARAGHIDQALRHLDQAVDAISDRAGPFEAVVLHSAAAAAALIRIQDGRDGWRDHANAYLARLEAYCPGFVPLPPLSADAAQMAQTLRDALSRLPY